MISLLDDRTIRHASNPARNFSARIFVFGFPRWSVVGPAKCPGEANEGERPARTLQTGAMTDPGFEMFRAAAGLFCVGVLSGDDHGPTKSAEAYDMVAGNAVKNFLRKKAGLVKVIAGESMLCLSHECGGRL